MEWCFEVGLSTTPTVVGRFPRFSSYYTFNRVSRGPAAIVEPPVLYSRILLLSLHFTQVQIKASKLTVDQYSDQPVDMALMVASANQTHEVQTTSASLSIVRVCLTMLTTSILADADGPRDAGSCPVDHCAVQRV